MKAFIVYCHPSEDSFILFSGLKLPQSLSGGLTESGHMDLLTVTEK